MYAWYIEMSAVLSDFVFFLFWTETDRRQRNEQGI